VNQQRGLTSLVVSPAVGFSLLVSVVAQTVSGVSTAPMWVRPAKDMVVVRVWSRRKPDPEPVGVLTKDAIVEVLEEASGWYRVRFIRENAEFVGWVLKDEVVVEGTPADPPQRIPKADPQPSPDKQEIAKPEKKTLSPQETHQKLSELVQVPVSEAPKVTTTFKLDGMKKDVKVSGTTGVSLFGPHQAKMEVLALFRPDEVIEVFVEDKIRELKKLLEEGHPDFSRVVDYYIRALEAYVEKKTPDFLRMINAAERYWKRIPGIQVGF